MRKAEFCICSMNLVDIRCLSEEDPNNGRERQLVGVHWLMASHPQQVLPSYDEI